MNKIKKIKTGIILSWTKFSLSFVVAIVQTPLLFLYLEQIEIGIWFLLYSTVVFITMADFGLPSAVSRSISYISSKEKKINEENVNFYISFSKGEIYSTSIKSYSVLILLSTLIIFFLTKYFISKSNDINEYNNLDLIIFIFLIGSFFNIVSNIPFACLNGTGNVGFDNLSKTISQIVGLILIVILLPKYKNITILVLIYLLQGLLLFIMSIMILNIKDKSFKLTNKIFKIELIKRLYKESVPLFLNQIGGWLTNHSTIWIATYFIGVEIIPNYSVMNQLVMYGIIISLSIPSALNPFMSAQFAERGIESLKKTFLIVNKLTIFFPLLWSILLFGWINELMLIWLKKEIFLGYYVLIPLVVNMVLEVQHSVSGGFIWNAGKWPFVKITILSGILNLVLGIYFGMRFGIIGLVSSQMISKLITLNWYVVYKTLSLLGIKTKYYIVNYLLKISNFYLIFLFLNNEFINIMYVNVFKKILLSINTSLNTNIIYLSAIMITIVLFTIFYFIIIFSKEEKILIKKILNQNKK